METRKPTFKRNQWTVNESLSIFGSSFQHRAVFNTLGVVLLLLGIGSASLVYWAGHVRSERQSPRLGTSKVEGDWEDGTLPPEDSKRDSRDLELYYGKVGALVVRWWLRWEALEPSERLAIIIATVSTLAAFACFLLANRLPFEAPASILET